MAQKEVKMTVINPFLTRRNPTKKRDFDKYYFDVSEKDVFKKTGVDADGEELGIIEKKLIVKKIDIEDYLNSQADSVGIEAYMRSMAIQGVDPDSFSTQVKEDIQDFSQMPDTLADLMMAGDKAKAAFAALDPDLKGGHTTIEGFLNSLTQEKIDSYIQGKIDATLPKNTEAAGGEK